MMTLTFEPAAMSAIRSIYRCGGRSIKDLGTLLGALHFIKRNPIDGIHELEAQEQLSIVRDLDDMIYCIIHPHACLIEAELMISKTDDKKSVRFISMIDVRLVEGSRNA